MTKYNNPCKASHTVPATEYTLTYDYILPDPFSFEMDVNPHIRSIAQKHCLCLKMSLILYSLKSIISTGQP